MSSEIPDQNLVDPLGSRFIYINRFGGKCIICTAAQVIRPFLGEVGSSTEKTDDQAWLEVGAVGRAFSENTPRGLVHWQGEAIDTKQARIYYRHLEGADPECKIVLPDDMPFRASKKGFRKEHTKSFDDEGNPLPGAWLLFALKTGVLEHEHMAIRALLSYEERPDENVMGEWMRLYIESGKDFKTFVAKLLLRAAFHAGELAKWALWDHLAEVAAAYTRDQLALASGKRPPDKRDLFAQAVREVTLKHQGIPMQKEVRERWEKLSPEGDWDDIREDLGFDWLPTQREHKREWDKFITSKGASTCKSRVVSLEGMNDLEQIAEGLADEELQGDWLAPDEPTS